MGEIIRRIVRVPKDGVIRIAANGVAPGTLVEIVIELDPEARSRALAAWRDAARRLRAGRAGRVSQRTILAETKALGT